MIQARVGLFRSSRVRRQHGAALVEFALALPLFMGVLLAIVDFGDYFNARLALSSAAYNGAKQRAGSCGSTGQVTNAVRQSVASVISDPQNITVSNAATGSSATRYYTVTVQYARPLSGLSIFTSSIATLQTIQASGMALCGAQCSGSCS